MILINGRLVSRLTKCVEKQNHIFSIGLDYRFYLLFVSSIISQNDRSNKKSTNQHQIKYPLINNL